MQTDLLNAYRYRRVNTHWQGRERYPATAVNALQRARDDIALMNSAQAAYTAACAAHSADPTAANRIAQGVALKRASEARRPSYGPSSPACVSWQARDASGSPYRLARQYAHIEKPGAFGLRFVGNVEAESHGGRNAWSKRDSCGWFTDPFGEYSTDGTGLCRGVVYQLPARGGRARFVAGYQFGGTDSGPTLDLGNIFESASAGNCQYEGAQGHDDARDAARQADSLAQAAAESEREYQTAWAAGSAWGQLGEEIADTRRDALALIRELKTVRHTFAGAANVAHLCAAIREKIDSAVESISEARAKRAALASGDGPDLYFYTGEERLKGAFCEAAGLKVFPS